MALVTHDSRPVDVVDRTTGEVLHENVAVDAGALVVARPTPLSFGEVVERLASPEALEQQQKFMAAYDRAVRALIGPNDVHRASDGREYKKKSAWRKLARWAGISTEIVRADRWWEEDPDGARHYVARVVVRATAPWGQTAEAVGLCDTREARFRSAAARAKATHDVEATAATRATNRAISDLIAAGEVSAEEIEHDGAPEPAPRPSRPRASRPAMGDSAPTGEMASERQIQFIRRLLDERDVDEATRDAAESAIEAGQLTRREASRLIGDLMSRPKVADEHPAPADAPFSSPFDDEDDDLPF